MLQKEADELQTLLTKHTFDARPKALDWLSRQTVDMPVEGPKMPPKRTESQNAAYWLWLTQIAEICQREQITADMIFKHTAHVVVSKEMLHAAVKTLIKVKWDLDSTKELNKTGHLDEIQDVMALWLGKEGVELPPWPSDESKKENNLTITTKMKEVEYPVDPYEGQETGTF